MCENRAECKGNSMGTSLQFYHKKSKRKHKLELRASVYETKQQFQITILKWRMYKGSTNQLVLQKRLLI